MPQPIETAAFNSEQNLMAGMVGNLTAPIGKHISNLQQVVFFLVFSGFQGVFYTHKIYLIYI